MKSILFLSDVVLDPVVKEIKLLSGGRVSIEANYEEDIISKLLTVSDVDLNKYDLIFIHSDQFFHQKDQSWQKMYCSAILNLSKRFSRNILVSNAFSLSYKALPLKSSFGNTLDITNVFGDDFKDLTGQANIYVFNFIDQLMNIGAHNFYNYNLGHLYQMPYTKQGIKHIASEFTEQIKFFSTEEKKAIILDCDNTLWKGVVGEDGVDGIFCDRNAEGILHYHLQLFLKAKKEEGFLLCLCSKNNEADVKEAFYKKSMPLKWEDFIVTKINWLDKVSNISGISKELNIGIDSFIFIDDNLFELNSIKELMGGVTCIHLSDNFNELLNNMNSFVFRRKYILHDDINKTEQYKIEEQRNTEEQKFSSLDDFIESLNIRLDIRVNDIADFSRLSQMTGKTNQFNFNKHSYNEDELRAFIENGRIYSLKVSDKYGDYGTVGLIMIAINGKVAMMENYLVSCRALGKKIEYSFYDQVVSNLSGEGIEIKDIRFIITDKNQPAQTFLKSINYESKH